MYWVEKFEIKWKWNSSPLLIGAIENWFNSNENKSFLSVNSVVHPLFLKYTTDGSCDNFLKIKIGLSNIESKNLKWRNLSTPGSRESDIGESNSISTLSFLKIIIIF